MKYQKRDIYKKNIARNDFLINNFNSNLWRAASN